MSAPLICAIVAMDERRVIGVRGDLPWRIPADMKRFVELTSGHTVIMGRKTYDSLPPKFRPLPNRRNLVATRTGEISGAVEIVRDIKALMAAVKQGRYQLQGETLWVIGGEQIYRETMEFWDEVYLTRVLGEHEGDAFFPEFEADYQLTDDEPQDGFSFQRYVRKNVK